MYTYPHLTNYVKSCPDNGFGVKNKRSYHYFRPSLTVCPGGTFHKGEGGSIKKTSKHLLINEE